jgi:hypothetical protein
VERTETKRGVVFEYEVWDELPMNGEHCVGSTQGEGRAVILHSSECPEADLAEMRATLELLVNLRFCTNQNYHVGGLALAPGR